MAQKDGFIEFPHAKNIVVSGDIHGDIAPLVNKCCVQYGMTDTLIIVAGDCGFGFERPGYYEAVYKRCSNILSNRNCWLAFVRGNHDNPAYFNTRPIKHRRWMTLPDYTVIKACGHTILCVGGATSIDRAWRMDAKQYRLHREDAPFMPNVYWPNEQPVYDEKKLDVINEKCAIDTVITHTSPSFCELSSHFALEDWAMHDDRLMEDVKHERKVMDDLYNYLYIKCHPVSYWYYGHFHESWHAKIDDVKFHMLDIMELIEIK
ncbi:MAG: metallophosphoesterase [Bacteroidaceae bacterium]|nr:metallophosphoesterase [Bacteroidaceae bacterium]